MKRYAWLWSGLAGAVVLPVVHHLAHAIVVWCMIPEMTTGYTFRGWTSSIFRTAFQERVLSGLLGVASAMMFVAWKSRNRHQLTRATWSALLLVFIFVGLAIYHANITLNTPAPQSIKQPFIVASFLANLPLQWAVALAIVGRIGVKRLEREERERQRSSE